MLFSEWETEAWNLTDPKSQMLLRIIPMVTIKGIYNYPHCTYGQNSSVIDNNLLQFSSY